MTVTELECVNCGAPLRAESYIARLGALRCTHCGALMAAGSRSDPPPAMATQDGPPLPPPSAAPPEVLPRNLPAPPGIDVDDQPHQLTLTRRWFSGGTAFLAAIGLVGGAMLAAWYLIAFAIGSTFGVMMAFIGLPFVLIGLPLVYAALAGVLNRTTLRARRGTLTVRHGPVPGEYRSASG